MPSNFNGKHRRILIHSKQPGANFKLFNKKKNYGKLLNVPVEENICLSILYCEWIDATAVAVVKLVPFFIEAVARICDVMAAI